MRFSNPAVIDTAKRHLIVQKVEDTIVDDSISRTGLLKHLFIAFAFVEDVKS